MRWALQRVAFHFALGDFVLFDVSLRMQVRSLRISDFKAPVSSPEPPDDELFAGCQGFAVRNLPIARSQPPLRSCGSYLVYVPLQYERCYIDLSTSFEAYEKKFSSKTRSTIQRKLKKYRQNCGGDIPWKCYSRPGELADFLRLARQISRRTYQERLHGAGIPDTDEFLRESMALAASDNLRAFILFDGERPVSYLYCPVRDRTLIYAYLGYDPEYAALSVGTVLQWIAVESVFREQRFRYFDFDEGEGAHKRLFATDQRLCANVFFVRRTLPNALLIRAHYFTDSLSKLLGSALDRFGVKAKIKRFLRRAEGPRSHSRRGGPKIPDGR